MDENQIVRASDLILQEMEVIKKELKHEQVDEEFLAKN